MHIPYLHKFLLLYIYHYLLNSVKLTWLLSIRPALTVLKILLVCILLFPLTHEESPPVVTISDLESSNIGFLSSIDFSKAPSSLTLVLMRVWCLFLDVVRMKQMMCTGLFWMQ